MTPSRGKLRVCATNQKAKAGMKRVAQLPLAASLENTFAESQ
jgi:hypothetical protein